MTQPTLRVDRAVAVTALLVLVAIGATVHSMRQTPRLLHQIRSRQERLNRLLELQAQHGNISERVQAFAAAERTRPAAVRAVIGNLMPDERVNVADVEPRALGHGVVLQQTDVQFEAVDLAMLAALIDRLESYDPPWKLRTCTLRAVGDEPGRAQARLTFEALESR